MGGKSGGSLRGRPGTDNLRKGIGVILREVNKIVKGKKGGNLKRGRVDRTGGW